MDSIKKIVKRDGSCLLYTSQMLGTHMRFMAQVNKEAAVKKHKEIITAMRSLFQMPQRFPFFDEMYIKPNKYHKMFIEKWYLVIYQIKDDTVYIELSLIHI